MPELIGRMIDVRSRELDGSVRYMSENPNAPENFQKMRKLTFVGWRKEGSHNWLRWEWEKDHSSFDCGYSGMREDCKDLESTAILVAA